VLIIGALAAALGFGVVLVAKLALALLVALGPIFIACALFDATRRFFFGWLSQAVNYLVLFALMIVIFQLVLSLVRDQWGSIQGADPMIGGLTLDELQRMALMLFPGHDKADPFWSEAARTGFIGVGGYVAATPELPFTLGEIFRQLTGADARTRLRELTPSLGG